MSIKTEYRATAGLLRSLASAISVGHGHGLEVYLPAQRMLPGTAVELVPPALDERPFLKLMVDMDATNLAAANYLWAMGVRGFHDTDPAHRHDNDAMLAIKRAGLFPALAKLTMLANVNRGPWLGGGFMEQKSEAMAMHLEAMWRDPHEMASHL